MTATQSFALLALRLVTSPFADRFAYKLRLLQVDGETLVRSVTADFRNQLPVAGEFSSLVSRESLEPRR